MSPLVGPQGPRPSLLMATGMSGSDDVVNDPAGKWNQSFKGGCPYGWNAQIGKGIVYGKAKFEQAISTLNGSGFEPLWYHELIN